MKRYRGLSASDSVAVSAALHELAVKVDKLGVSMCGRCLSSWSKRDGEPEGHEPGCEIGTAATCMRNYRELTKPPAVRCIRCGRFESLDLAESERGEDWEHFYCRGCQS